MQNLKLNAYVAPTAETLSVQSSVDANSSGGLRLGTVQIHQARLNFFSRLHLQLRQVVFDRLYCDRP